MARAIVTAMAVTRPLLIVASRCRVPVPARTAPVVVVPVAMLNCAQADAGADYAAHRRTVSSANALSDQCTNASTEQSASDAITPATRLGRLLCSQRRTNYQHQCRGRTAKPT